MISTTIHRLDGEGKHCALCDAEIPDRHQAKPGEYVGVITYPVLKMQGVYRIGEGNKDSLCNGDPHTSFYQPAPK